MPPMHTDTDASTRHDTIQSLVAGRRKERHWLDWTPWRLQATLRRQADAVRAVSPVPVQRKRRSCSPPELATPGDHWTRETELPAGGTEEAWLNSPLAPSLTCEPNATISASTTAYMNVCIICFLIAPSAQTFFFFIAHIKLFLCSPHRRRSITTDIRPVDQLRPWNRTLWL